MAKNNGMRQLKITKSVTVRDENFDKYLSEMGKIELIDALEEVELTQKIKDGDQQALEKLVKSNLRFVVSVAKQYQNQGMFLPDLVNEGNLGLIKAASKFDETRGFKFISYAVWWIRQAILSALADKGRIVRLPLNQVNTLSKYNKTFSQLEQELERDPTEQEIAEIMEEEPNFMNNLRGSTMRPASLDQSIAGFNDSDDMTLMDLLGTPPEEDTDKGLNIESLKKEIKLVLTQLSIREGEIVRLFFGIDENHEWTLEEIGKKFELTPERVRQIKERGLRRLRHRSHHGKLREYLG
ncbi:MAG: sigma-70 family RNA polymerase sigma factor [Candidatus Absconditabacterales bacterium]